MPISRWSPCSPCCGNDKLVYTTSFFDKSTGNYLSDLDYLGVPRWQSSDDNGLVIGGYNSEKLTIIEQKTGVYTFELYDPEPSGSFKLYFLTGSQFFTYVTADIPSRSTGIQLVEAINSAFHANRATLIKNGVLGVSKITIKFSNSLSAAVPGDSIGYGVKQNTPGLNTVDQYTTPLVHKVLVQKLTNRHSLRQFNNTGQLVKDLKQDKVLSEYNNQIQRDILHMKKVGNKVHYIRDDGVTYRDMITSSPKPYNTYEAFKRRVTYITPAYPTKGSRPNYNRRVIISGVDRSSPITLTITINNTTRTVSVSADPTPAQLGNAINAQVPGCCRYWSEEPLSIGNFSYSDVRDGHPGIVMGRYIYVPGSPNGYVQKYAITDSNHIVFAFNVSDFQEAFGVYPTYFNITTNNGTIVTGNYITGVKEQYILESTYDPTVPIPREAAYSDFLRTGGTVNSYATFNDFIAALNALPGCSGLFTGSVETIQVNKIVEDPFYTEYFSYACMITVNDKFPIYFAGSSYIGEIKKTYLGTEQYLTIQQQDGVTDTFSFDYQTALGQPMQHGAELNLGNTPSDVAQTLKTFYGNDYVNFVDKKFDNSSVSAIGTGVFPNNYPVIYPQMKFLLSIAKPQNKLLLRSHGDSDYQIYDLDENKIIKKRDTSYRFLRIETVGDRVYAIGNYTSFFTNTFQGIYRQLVEFDEKGDIKKDAPLGVDSNGNLTEYGYNGKLNFLRYSSINNLLYVGGGTQTYLPQYLWTGTAYTSPILMFDLDLNYVKSLPFAYGEVYDVAFIDSGYFTLVNYNGDFTIFKHRYADDAIVWQKQFNARAICSDEKNLYVTIQDNIEGATVHCLDGVTGNIIWSTRNPYRANYTQDDFYYLISIMGDKVVTSGVRKERIARLPVRRLGVSDEVVINESATHVT